MNQTCSKCGEQFESDPLSREEFLLPCPLCLKCRNLPCLSPKDSPLVAALSGREIARGQIKANNQFSEACGRLTKDMADKKRKALLMITEAEIKKFYGKLTLSFEHGKITIVRKEETIKL